MTTDQKPKAKLSSLFFNDEEKQKGGWVDLPDGVRVKAIGWTSAFAEQVKEDLLKKRPVDLIPGSDEFMAAAKANPIEHARKVRDAETEDRRETLASLITGWENFAGIPFSEQNLRVICTKDAAQGARDLLFQATFDVGKFKAGSDEGAVKNFVAGLGINFDSQE